MRRLPRYPIFIPSKGRWQKERALTAGFFERDRVPFRLVVEPQERDAYVARFGEDRVVVLDRSGGGLLYARNWIRDLAESEGYARHWQFDDNIGQVRRLYAGERIPADSGPAIRVVEDFTDRYTNVALSGFNYQMFVTPTSPPYRTNVHVYSATLVNHAYEKRWRLLYNDDTDICLQALHDGWTTILVNLYMVDKKTTMTVAGGNYNAEGPINYEGDGYTAAALEENEELAHGGRLKMARVLEEAWPKVVTVDWRFGRPQHVVDWSRFRTELRLRDDVDLDALRASGPDEYGSDLVARAEARHPEIQELLDGWRARREKASPAAYTPSSRDEPLAEEETVGAATPSAEKLPAS